MDIQPLKTEADHAAAVAEIETLMDAEPGSEAFDRLDALSTLVDDYEARVHPIAAPDPVDALLFRLEQLGDPRIEVSDYIDVSSKLEELGCAQPEGIGILPERFDTCTSADKPSLLRRTRTVVRLFEDSNIPVSIIEKEGQPVEYTYIASSEWFTGVGPTFLISAALLAENPHIISLALNVLANYLTEIFKRAREENPDLGKGDIEGNAILEIVVEKDGPRTYKKIKCPVTPEMLKELPKIIKSIR